MRRSWSLGRFRLRELGSRGSVMACVYIVLLVVYNISRNGSPEDTDLVCNSFIPVDVLLIDINSSCWHRFLQTCFHFVRSDCTRAFFKSLRPGITPCA
jgi:hypothetical protein